MRIANSISLISSEYLKPFWQHAQIYPKQTSRHIFGTYNYNYIINVEKLKKSLQKVFERNYNLRSNFIQDDTSIKQLIKTNIDVKLTVYATNSASERAALLRNLVAKPFNLSKEILFRIYLIKNTTTNQSTLLAIFHHIIIDGTQFDTIMHELAACYRGNILSEPTPVEALENYLNMEKYNINQANVNYWLKQLEGYPLNIDFKDINKKTPSSQQKTAIKAFQLSSDTTTSIIDFSKENKISLFNFLKIMWATLIGRHCSQEKLVIAHAVSVRTSDFSLLKGSFINILPFAIDLNTTLSPTNSKIQHSY